MTWGGGKPHTNVGDRGQRYEVTYQDGDEGPRKVLGWSDTLDGAEGFCDAVRVHPSWRNPLIRDRESTDECTPKSA